MHILEAITKPTVPRISCLYKLALYTHLTTSSITLFQLIYLSSFTQLLSEVRVLEF